MVEAIFDGMGAVLSRWAMGAPAASAAPTWMDELGGESGEAELRLLALCSQFLAVAVIAEPPASLRASPDIPALALPALPEELRPLLRRILAGAKESRQRNDLLELLETRGRTTHPGDWMPAWNDEDAPDVYAPWRDWAEIVVSKPMARQRAVGELTVENWNEFGPATRKSALMKLRRRDPAAARELIETKFSGADAEARLSMLHQMTMRLSAADTAFLDQIESADRAPKVKALAAMLLARLGHGREAGEHATELAGFFSVQRPGALRNSPRVDPQDLKTPAQRQRRTALFGSVDVASFAKALGLGPEELIEAWVWKIDGHADQALIHMVARSGSDALARSTAKAASELESSSLHGLTELAPRLAPDDRTLLAAKILRERECGFGIAKVIGGGVGWLEDPLDTPAGTALLAALGAEGAKPSDQAAELYALGLVASCAGAGRALEQLTAAGLLQGDPRLDMLRLNAALRDSGARE